MTSSSQFSDQLNFSRSLYWISLVCLIPYEWTSIIRISAASPAKVLAHFVLCCLSWEYWTPLRRQWDVSTKLDAVCGSVVIVKTKWMKENACSIAKPEGIVTFVHSDKIWPYRVFCRLMKTLCEKACLC